LLFRGVVNVIGVPWGFDRDIIQNIVKKLDKRV